MSLIARLLFAWMMTGTVLPAQAAPALWEVNDANSKLWLFGSVHVLPTGLNWRTPLFNQILADANAVYFETDVSKAGQGVIGARSMQVGINPMGQSLTSMLTPDQSSALKAAVAELGLPIGLVESFKPWLATSTISSVAMAKAGYDPLSGVDISLENELPTERQRYLETAAEQIDILAGSPDAQQLAMLSDTITQLDQVPDLTRDMVKAWQKGSTDGVIADIFQEFDAYDGLADRMLYNRNRNWLKSLRTMLSDDEQNLIVVGLGHLVGDNSVIDLLEAEGFTVKRIQ